MLPPTTPARPPVRGSAFQAWFPAVPFLFYWIATLLLYQFGPIVNDELRPQTLVFVIGGLTCFALGYGSGVRGRRPAAAASVARETALAYSWLRWAAPAALLGIAGLVADRLLSGAGSPGLTLMETQYVREEFAWNTTWITTLSVVPYCFSLVSLTAYFLCLRRRPLPRAMHAMIFAQLALHAFNTFLSANRGNFYWLPTYWLFYIFLVRGSSIRAFLFSRALRVTRLAFIGLLVIAVSYIYFIARHRNSEGYLTYLANTNAQSLRYDLPDIDTPTLGALINLMQYGTHQYGFIDAFLERADPLAFNPVSLLGGRVLDQIRKVVPDYEPQERIIADQWISEAGLPPWAWPSVFGWLLAMFGYVGAAAFLALLGFAGGWLARTYLSTGSFAVLLLLFCLYTALNLSYLWIGGDLQQNTGYVVGLGLLYWRRGTPG